MKKLKRTLARFLICVDNKGYTVSLEKRKIYLALPDTDALKHGQVRVIDESGEDYLYPKVSSCPLRFPNLFGKPFSKRHSE
jgi:hypothetical protein